MGEPEPKREVKWISELMDKTVEQIDDDRLHILATDALSLSELVVSLAFVRGEDLTLVGMETLALRTANARGIFLLERVRRGIAFDRANLSCLAHMPVIQADIGRLDLNPQEFMRGLSMRVREKTGIEVTVEDVRKIVDKLKPDGGDDAAGQ